MSAVSDLLSRIGYNIGLEIASGSDPSQATCISWMNETLLWITGILAEENSEIGRTLGTITTVKSAITGITQANPGVVTSESHGLSDGDAVLIKSVGGMTEVNDAWFTVANKTDDTFELSGTDTRSYTAYSSGGYVYKAKYTLASNIYAVGQMGWIQDTYKRDRVYIGREEEEADYNPANVSQPGKYYLDGNSLVTFLDTPDDAYTVRIPYWSIPTALSDTTDTVPYGGIFDNLIVEAVTMKAQNRDEYDLSFDLKWFQFIIEKARRVIRLRRGTSVSVSGVRG